MELPCRVKVCELVSGRYAPGQRPISWDERKADVEVVKIEGGKELRLASSGGQSSPDKGWEILLTKHVPDSDAYAWTLFGVSAVAKASTFAKASA